jgi:hypothetical protein
MSLVDLTISDRRINVLAGYANWGMGDSPVLVRSDRSFPCALCYSQKGGTRCTRDLRPNIAVTMGILHSNTRASLTAFFRSCSDPKYRSVVKIDSCPSRN